MKEEDKIFEVKFPEKYKQSRKRFEWITLISQIMIIIFSIYFRGFDLISLIIISFTTMISIFLYYFSKALSRKRHPVMVRVNNIGLHVWKIDGKEILIKWGMIHKIEKVTFSKEIYVLTYRDEKSLSGNLFDYSDMIYFNLEAGNYIVTKFDEYKLTYYQSHNPTSFSS